MRNLYFSLLVLCTNISLHSMKQTKEIVAAPTTAYNFCNIPDDVKFYIIVQTYDWHNNPNNLSAIAQTIFSLQRTHKSFKTLLSDENLVKLFSLNKNNMNNFLFSCVKVKAPFLASFAHTIGADVNYYNEKLQLTPLLQATINDDYPTCKLLLSKGANINRNNAPLSGKMPEGSLFYPIHVAIEKKNPRMIKLFMMADPDIQENNFKVTLVTDAAGLVIKIKIKNTLTLALKSKNEEIIKIIEQYFENDAIDIL